MANGWVLDRAADTAEVIRLSAFVNSLGKDDAVSLAFSGLALGYVVGDAEAGLAFVDRALALNPNLPSALSASGCLRACHHDPDATIAHFEQAMRLSPLDPIMFFMLTFSAFAHFVASRYETGCRLAEAACREQPNFLTGLRVAAACNASAGRMDAAGRFIARAQELDPGLRLETLAARVGAIKPAYFAKYAAALRLAGLLG